MLREGEEVVWEGYDGGGVGRGGLLSEGTPRTAARTAEMVGGGRMQYKKGRMLCGRWREEDARGGGRCVRGRKLCGRGMMEEE